MAHAARRVVVPESTAPYTHTMHRKKSQQQSDLLPWEAFLPAGGQDSENNKWPERRGTKEADFKELLDEGKKRLEKAGQEQQLRERAEVVGGMGECELEDLLADLCEPSFSRRQNE